MTVVINYVQKCWNSIAKVIRKQEEELYVRAVNAISYLTLEMYEEDLIPGGRLFQRFYAK